ncbi:hypothetical protein BN903_176 [Halorubrum sp. AJ67]|nr:hypothetical protein BN903_176 [Halorubrum sp. AJ67]
MNSTDRVLICHSILSVVMGLLVQNVRSTRTNVVLSDIAKTDVQ